jgi:uncharacterized lipoprotein YddW (UPF0748 family)
VVHKGDLTSPIGNGFYTYARKWDLDPGRTRAQQEDFLLRQQIAAVRFWITRRAASQVAEPRRLRSYQTRQP